MYLGAHTETHAMMKQVQLKLDLYGTQLAVAVIALHIGQL